MDAFEPFIPVELLFEMADPALFALGAVMKADEGRAKEHAA